MFPIKRMNDLIMSCMPWRQKKKVLVFKQANETLALTPQELARLLDLGLTLEQITRLLELGYTGAELIKLRERGLTVTELTRLRELGVGCDDIIRLLASGLTAADIIRMLELGMSLDEIFRMQEGLSRLAKSKECQTGPVAQTLDDSSTKQQLTDVVYGSALTPAPPAQWEACRRDAGLSDGRQAEECNANIGNERETRGFLPLPHPSAVSSVLPSDPDRLIKSMRDFRVIYTEDPWVRMQMDKLRRSLVGMCEHCKEAVYNEGVRGLGGLLYHPHHFSCAGCFTQFGAPSSENEELQNEHETHFYEHEGKAYCNGCYMASFAPKCTACAAPIGNDRGGAIAALGGTYHAACFECCTCRTVIGDAQAFIEYNGNPYCRQCYLDVLCPKCYECSAPIEDVYIKAFDNPYHRNCFYCVDCCDDGSSLLIQAVDKSGGACAEKDITYYFVYEGKPYCKHHYDERAGRQCCHCGRRIVGRCMSAMSRQFEEEQFVCAFCQRHLTAARFYEISVPTAVIRTTKSDQHGRANGLQEY